MLPPEPERQEAVRRVMAHRTRDPVSSRSDVMLRQHSGGSACSGRRSCDRVLEAHAAVVDADHRGRAAVTGFVERRGIAEGRVLVRHRFEAVERHIVPAAPSTCTGRAPPRMSATSPGSAPRSIDRSTVTRRHATTGSVRARPRHRQRDSDTPYFVRGASVQMQRSGDLCGFDTAQNRGNSDAGRCICTEPREARFATVDDASQYRTSDESSASYKRFVACFACTPARYTCVPETNMMNRAG